MKETWCGEKCGGKIVNKKQNLTKKKSKKRKWNWTGGESFSVLRMSE